MHHKYAKRVNKGDPDVCSMSLSSYSFFVEWENYKADVRVKQADKMPFDKSTSFISEYQS